MTVISTRDAKRRGMVALTVPMDRTDPALFEVYKDMVNINGTDWALVNAGFKKLEVWRVPSVSTLGWSDGRGGREKRGRKSGNGKFGNLEIGKEMVA